MNSRIYCLISSIASVILGIILLICVCLAWYPSNRLARADGMSGSTYSDECELNIDIYYLESYENNVYKKAANPIDFSNVSTSSPIQGDQGVGATIMNQFGEGITGILIVANVTLFEQANGLFQLSAFTATDKILMLESMDESKDITAQLNQYQNNMLSNVVHFEKATVDFGTNEVVVDNTSVTSFIENKQKKKTVQLEASIQKSEVEANAMVTKQFCYLMDYDESQVNYLYEQMLTIFGKNANLDTPMLFQSDISFSLKKGSGINEA